MNIIDLVMEFLSESGEVRVSDIVKKTGLSRAYVHKFFKKLQEEGRIVLIGRANLAKYVSARPEEINISRKAIVKITKTLVNKNLSEDEVLDEIQKNTGIFTGLPENVSNITEYAFTEMLNNAIDHSQAETIQINMKKEGGSVYFEVVDKGIGIFNNIMRKKGLNNIMEAIQDLLKGKETTAPEEHSGEGIFFTSRIAEVFIVQSSNKKMIFNNLLEDLFIRDTKERQGTKISFAIKEDSNKELEGLFREYTNDSFEFSTTRVNVKLYRLDTEYISRSQARRVVSGLSKFKEIVLDFQGVKMLGQGFADEVFRVWKKKNPDVNIIVQNANENIQFMIDRARKT